MSEPLAVTLARDRLVSTQAPSATRLATSRCTCRKYTAGATWSATRAALRLVVVGCVLRGPEILECERAGLQQVRHEQLWRAAKDIQEFAH
jgi:hypothetical protein